MIRTRRRRQPIESESSEDDYSQNGRLGQSSRPTILYSSEISNANKRYNIRNRRKVPIIVSEESSASETDEVVHPPRHGSMRALSDYDTCNSSDTEEEALSPQTHDVSGNETDSSDDVIQTRSGKRCKIIESSSSTDSSDSGVPVGFQRRKKRMKICSSSSEGSEDSSNDESTVRLDLGVNDREGSQERQNRPNTSRSSSRLTINSNISGNRNNMTQIRVILNGGWSMSVGNMENDNWSVRVSQINNDAESSDNDIRPRVLRNNSRRLFQSNSSSSSDSEDEIPIRRPRIRRVNKSIIESDKDDKSENENSNEILSESDDATDVCPICLNRFNLQVIGKPSNCDHCFCLTCIKEWAGNNNTCPVDRKEFTTIRVHSSINSNVVEEIPVFNTQRMFNGWGVGDVVDSDDSVVSINYNNSDFLVEPEGDICCVCLRGSRNNDMLYCDVCFDVYHLQCVEPPVHNFPAGAWFCANCEDN